MNRSIGPSDTQIDQMRENVFARIGESLPALEHAAGRSRQVLEGPTPIVLDRRPEATPHAAQKRRNGSFLTRRLSAISLAAAALVAILVIGNAFGWGPSGGATAEAASLLEQAAVATIQTSDPTVGPDQFLQISTHAVFATYAVGPNDDPKNLASRSVFLTPSTSTLYMPADKSGEWVWQRTALKPDTFFSEKAKVYALDQWKHLGPDERTGTFRAPDGNFDGSPWLGEDLAAMPSDPGALLSYFYETSNGGSNSPEENAMVRISDVLRSGLAPAELRAALYRAFAMIPGVTVVERSATLNGQVGVAIGRQDPTRDFRQDIIVDPATGLLIGERQVQVKADANVPANTVIGWTSVTTTVVDSAP
ncbi:CU044_5270 family protein [Cryobacterium tagatosivorans]|uniref:CU044_5270 family protein n=1 Tax=Cryobacterium tagatosivorans TaxID=1259199 RepID=A0A4R8UGZ2_9MICO|nr:CU044_5270 family protein [Cryobacterium tagatosivorans]TFB51975.1 hypothetical protein E3O23_07265 [Cryobacterium tagatosivorans]